MSESFELLHKEAFPGDITLMCESSRQARVMEEHDVSAPEGGISVLIRTRNDAATLPDLLRDFHRGQDRRGVPGVQYIIAVSYTHLTLPTIYSV